MGNGLLGFLQNAQQILLLKLRICLTWNANGTTIWQGNTNHPTVLHLILNHLKDSADIDVNAITHIRLIDVVGSINDSFARRDVKGRKINDPWPTDFESGGFDIDAVGVLQFPLSAPKQGVIKRFVNPNPSVSTNGFDVNMKFTTLTVYSLAGTVLYTDQSGERHLNPGLQEGLFIVKINTATGTFILPVFA